MPLFAERMAAIVARAGTLDERIAAGLGTARRPELGMPAERLVEQWRRVSALGDDVAFARRLARDGLNRDEIAHLLAPIDASDAPPPVWAVRLQDCLGLCGRFDLAALTEDAVSSSLDPTAPLPFEEAYWPFVAHAAEAARTMAGDAYGAFDTEAQVRLEAQLLHWLSYLGARALFATFDLRRGRRRPMPGGARPPRTLYRAFVTDLLTGGWWDLLETYPVLARLLGIAVEQWIAATVEMMRRFAADGADLARLFNDGRPLGTVRAATGGLSDRHHDGRTVLCLKFAGGVELIYKPRPVATEAAWRDLLAWIAAQAPGLTLYHPRVLAKDGYGWVEAVRARPCRDRTDVDAFFRNAGRLLALVHLLGGTDCHHENVIAAGSHPVLIDLETLLHHRPAAAPDEAGEILDESVSGTGFLPQWTLTETGTAFDSSALGGIAAQDTPFRLVRWTDANTDAMAAGRVVAMTRPVHNAATLDGVPRDPAGHVEDIADGFAEMHRFLAARKDALLDSAGPLQPFRGARVRNIFRHTNIYGMILDTSFAPALLRDGASRGIHFDVLSRPWRDSVETPRHWAALIHERRALERMDIPAFTALTAGTALHADGAELPDLMREPSFDALRRRIAGLDEEDLAFQCGVICASFTARTASRNDATAAGDGTAEPMEPAALVSAALDIARQIASQAVRARGSLVTWLTYDFHPAAGRFQLRVMDDGLYNGRAGVALFLAAVEHATGGAGLRGLAGELFDSLAARALARHPAAVPGLADGTAGIAYGLLRAAELLGEPRYRDAAARVLAAIDPRNVAGDGKHDVLLGGAGLLLSALAVGGDALPLATACGEHLLAARDSAGAWRTVNGERRSGFGHGAAGIAYALHRLGTAAGDGRFAEAADGALRFEEGLYVAGAGNWRVSAEDSGVLCKWCYGAPGIGMARLHCGCGRERPALADALAATLAFGDRDVDHLCCGTLGRTELLVGMAAYGRPDLLATARGWAAQVVARRRESGGYRLFSGMPPAVAPGLFQGSSGIGYQLLRLADPDRVPSLLLFQADRP